MDVAIVIGLNYNIKNTMKKYYNKSANIINYVWFNLLDENGKIIKEYPNEACFASITSYGISKKVKTILIYHDKRSVPYSEKSINRWIDDVNEIGFPCAFIGSNETHYNFQINLCDYKYKVHLFSTLMFIRAIYEQGICLIPEIYFQLMDEHPNADKFDMIQTAHKSNAIRLGGYSGANSGHMLTYKGNGDNVDSQTLFERFDGEIDVYCGKPGQWSGSVNCNDKWNKNARQYKR